jgi:pimeloyl-ACP methyl ester carboxylesterase
MPWLLPLLIPLLLSACVVWNGSVQHGDTSLSEPDGSRPRYAFPPKSKDRVFVFVHGIFGDALKTWQNKAGEFFWDRFRSDDVFKDSDVYVYGFPSRFRAQSFSIDQAVADMDQAFINDNVKKYKEIVIVAHSMGGLVAERYLLTVRSVASKVPLLFLFATPHEGSSITVLASVVSQNPGLETMLPGDRNQYLRNLEAEWRQAQAERSITTRIKCAYETRPTYGVWVVTELSATRPCDGLSSPSDADHIDIVKPRPVPDRSYDALRSAVREVTTSRAQGTSLGAALQTHLAVSAGPESRIVERREPIPLDIEVLLSTAETRPIDDVFLIFEFAHENGKPIPQGESIKYFSVTANSFRVPALTTSLNRRQIPVVLRAHRTGQFRIRIIASSDKGELRAEATISLVVEELGLAALSQQSLTDSPLFVVRGDVLDAHPYRFSDLLEFKTLLVREANRSNIGKATVWFTWDYVGALGGPVLRVLRDTSRRPQYSRHLNEVKSLEDTGYVPGGNIVPIGLSLYQIDLIDDQRMTFAEIKARCESLLLWAAGTRTPTTAVKLYAGRDRTQWTTDQPAIAFEVDSDCGATGRICETTLLVGGREYTERDSLEDESYSDFPVWIRLDHGRLMKFDLSGSGLGAFVCSPG